MKHNVTLSAKDVETVAGLAALSLREGRAEVIRIPLGGWVQGANELSHKISDERYLNLMPMTVFSHDSI